MVRYIITFLAGVLSVLLAGWAGLPGWAAGDNMQLQATQPASPVPSQTAQRTYITPSPTQGITPTSQPTLTPSPVPSLAAGADSLGWAGQQQCWNCTPFTAKVILHHYNPTEFNEDYPQLNCWDYSKKHKYCLSPVWIGIPWEAVWGIAAACPATWAVGTWVDIPGVGMFICMDQGQDITCNSEDVCMVDLLGPGGGWWDGKEFTVTLWVPQSFLIRYSERN